jgi:hypothetical protein
MYGREPLLQKIYLFSKELDIPTLNMPDEGMTIFADCFLAMNIFKNVLWNKMG